MSGLSDPAPLDTKARDTLRYPAEQGDDWADIIDMLTMHPGGATESVSPTRRDSKPRNRSRSPVLPVALTCGDANSRKNRKELM
jgi:hypothetical protein